MVLTLKKRDAMSKFSMRTAQKHNVGFVFLFIFGMICSLPSVASWSNLGVRSQSLGGAYRAVASANDIIFHNPAGLIKNRRVGADADYMVATESKLNDLTVSIVDSRTTAWGLGIAYNAGLTAITDVKTTHLMYTAVAMPLGTDQISLGAGFSYFYDPRTSNDPFRHFFNIDVGIFADLGMGFRFAAVADHLLRAKGAEKGLGLSIGSALVLADLFPSLPLTTSFDWSMRDVKSDGELDHVVSLGFQYVAFEMLPVRIGYRSEIKDNNKVINLGTGILIEGFSLDALYQQNLIVGKNRQFGVAVRIQI